MSRQKDSMIRMRIRHLGLHGVVAAAIVLGITGTAYGSVFGDDEARKAILDLRAQVDANQRDLSSRIDKLESAQKAQLDLANQIDALRQDMARLRGQLELLSNDVANEEKREKDFYTDLDTRLRKLEPQQVSIDGKNATVDPNESKAYEAALEQFKNSDFKGAIASFNAFMKQYPDSAYAPAAQYWIGTSYYAQRDYKAAIASQQTLVKTWPENPRAADALLNIASSQTDMGDKKTAKHTLEQLIAAYPDSQAAGVAKDRVASLH